MASQKIFMYWRDYKCAVSVENGRYFQNIMDMYRYPGGASGSDFYSLEVGKSSRERTFALWTPNLTCEERAITIVKRLYYSEFSKYLYLGVFVLNILVLFTGLFSGQSGSRFSIFLETVITLTLTFEVTIKLFLMKSRFLSKANNVFDFVVAFTCLSLLLLNGDIHRLLSTRSSAHPENNQIVSFANPANANALRTPGDGLRFR